jgi:hypothetical protein
MKFLASEMLSEPTEYHPKLGRCSALRCVGLVADGIRD